MLAGAWNLDVFFSHTVAIALVHDCYLDGNTVCGGFGVGVIGEAGNAGVGEIYETQRCCETSIGATDHQDTVAARDGSDEIVRRHGGGNLGGEGRERGNEKKEKKEAESQEV